MVFAPVPLQLVAMSFEQKHPQMYVSFERGDPNPFYYMRVHVGLRVLDSPVCTFVINKRKICADTFRRLLEAKYKTVMVKGARL
jgi:hypothetical protein